MTNKQKNQSLDKLKEKKPSQNWRQDRLILGYKSPYIPILPVIKPQPAVMGWVFNFRRRSKKKLSAWLPLDFGMGILLYLRH